MREVLDHFIKKSWRGWGRLLLRAVTEELSQTSLLGLEIPSFPLGLDFVFPLDLPVSMSSLFTRTLVLLD